MIEDGVWDVLTYSGAHYVVDFEERTLIRTAKEQLDWPLAKLRKDGEGVTFVSVDRMEVGEPMTLLLHGVNDDPDVYTYRWSTPVLTMARRADG